MGDDGAVPGPEGRPGAGVPDPGLEASRMMREGELCPGTEPVGELCRGVEAAHPEDLLELGQGVEVLGARGACGQGAAGRQIIDAEPGLQVIEQEAGIAELDSDDRRLVWETIGGEQRVATGFADILVEDDVAAIYGALRTAFGAGVPAEHRSEQVGRYEARLAGIDVSELLDGPALRARWEGR